MSVCDEDNRVKNEKGEESEDNVKRHDSLENDKMTATSGRRRQPMCRYSVLWLCVSVPWRQWPAMATWWRRPADGIEIPGGYTILVLVVMA